MIKKFIKLMFLLFLLSFFKHSFIFIIPGLLIFLLYKIVKLRYVREVLVGLVLLATMQVTIFVSDGGMHEELEGKDQEGLSKVADFINEKTQDFEKFINNKNKEKINDLEEYNEKIYEKKTE